MSFAYAMSVRQGGHSPRRYRRHLATQLAAVRGLRRACDSGQRWSLARHRRKTGAHGLGNVPAHPETTAMPEQAGDPVAAEQTP